MDYIERKKKTLLAINKDFTLTFLFQICGFLFVVFLPSKIQLLPGFFFVPWLHYCCISSV